MIRIPAVYPGWRMKAYGPVVTTCWPRSVWMRMTEEKNRFTRMAHSARAYPAATVNRPTPCSQPGTLSLQWKRPRSSPATVQCMNSTGEKIRSESGGFLPPGRMRSRKRSGSSVANETIHDDGENCEIGPKARDGDRAGRCEQCGGRGD